MLKRYGLVLAVVLLGANVMSWLLSEDDQQSADNSLNTNTDLSFDTLPKWVEWKILDGEEKGFGNTDLFVDESPRRAETKSAEKTKPAKMKSSVAPSGTKASLSEVEIVAVSTSGENPTAMIRVGGKIKMVFINDVVNGKYRVRNISHDGVDLVLLNESE